MIGETVVPVYTSSGLQKIVEGAMDKRATGETSKNAHSSAPPCPCVCLCKLECGAVPLVGPVRTRVRGGAPACALAPSRTH